MMNKSTIILILLFISSFKWGLTQPVSKEKAIEFAEQFYNSRIEATLARSEEPVIAKINVRNGSSGTLYYIINFRGGGFILISGNLRFYPVLAYSFQGNFNPDDIPDNCRSWMDQYEMQMEFALREGGPFFPGISRVWDDYGKRAGYLKPVSFVLPLLTSEWSQFDYYNEMCPADPEAYGGHAPTGCVALAMAQLVYYYRFPEQGIGTVLYTPGYQGGIYGPQYVDFSTANYYWTWMTDACHESNQAVAQICYHTGVSVETAYAPSGSGADIKDVSDALSSHFKYLADEYLPRANVQNTTEWVSKLIQNIDEKKPVLYRSTYGWSGHVYICDGYQDSTHFHFNWGWGGAYNGYFYIDNLVPGGINLTSSQGAIFNVFPDTTQYQYPLFYPDTVLLTSRSGSIEDGSGPYVYQDDFYRAWRIQPDDPEITNILLEFSMLHTEYGNDVIRVYDGNSDEAPLLLAASGDDLPPSIESSGPVLFVTFQSDGQVHSDGFRASYYGFHIPFCAETPVLTDITGIVEDGSGYMKYRNNTDCNWLIEPDISPEDSITGVSLFFNEFNLAGGDTLYVHQVTDTSAVLLAKFTQGDTPGTLLSSGSKVLIHFTSDNSATAQGWEIIWDCTFPSYCSDTTYYYDSEGLLSDGSGDKNYLQNTDCYYVVDIAGAQKIHIKFLEFNLEKDYDYLKFFDPLNPAIPLFKFSGDTLPSEISIPLDKILIHFHSDEMDEYPGWKLSYTASYTGIPENNFKVSLFPNPVHTLLKVEVGQRCPFPSKYKISRIDGAVILAGDITKSPEFIQVSNLKPGVYILSVEDGKLWHYQKIVKY